ncbi:MAG: hypothetical protein AB8B66_01615 [Rickettsiaceae bacterium]
MKKSLKTLIKLNKNKLDNIVKLIQLRESELQKVIDKQVQLQTEIELETEKYCLSEYSFMLEKYLENSRKLTKKLEAKNIQLEGIIQKLRGALKDQYSDLKRFEIALAKKEKEEQIDLQILENKKLDEFNIINASTVVN